MISRRDNLLNRPWQDRRFENHRRKVKSALPAIDNRSPPRRNHVTLKMKKCQKETERCEKISKDNLILLKKLGNTMRTSRVDNYWTTPQPNFLNRISLYNNVIPRFEDMFIDFGSDIIEDIKDEEKRDRKSKCYACTPQKIEEIKVPEERVPWEPEKPPVISNRKRSKSVPVHKRRTEETLPVIVREKKSYSASTVSSSQRVKSGVTISKYTTKNKIIRDLDAKSPQSIILSRGCLKLSVNFPSDTLVKLQEGSAERVIVQGLCHCNKSYKTVY